MHIIEITIPALFYNLRISGYLAIDPRLSRNVERKALIELCKNLILIILYRKKYYYKLQ